MKCFDFMECVNIAECTKQGRCIDDKPPTTATKAGGAVLPVVGYFNSFGNALCKGVPRFSTDIALTPHAPAQATVDELRAEVERLTRERDEARESERQVCEQCEAMATEFSALKAKQIDVEAVMRLADEYANSEGRARGCDINYVHTYRKQSDAAREALRASLLGDGGTP